MSLPSPQGYIPKKLCCAVSPWSGEQCKAKAVGPNTLKKGTREFLDDRFCQMHQPGREPKKKCTCPHCNYHRSRDKYPLANTDKTLKEGDNSDAHLLDNSYGRSYKSSRKSGDRTRFLFVK